MTDNKLQRIQNYIVNEINILKEELKDKTLYKKNPYPQEVSVVQNIEDREE